MDLATGYRRIAEFASHGEDGRYRREMLQLALELADVPDAVALLWLYDEPKHRFHLDWVEPLETEAATEAVHGISLRCNADLASSADALRNLAHADHRIREHLGETRCDGSVYFPVQVAKGSSGFLVLATSGKLTEVSIALLDQLAKIIAARISRHREVRELRVYQKLAPIQGTDDRSQDWLELAAKEAQAATSAELSLVFRRSPDLKLRVVAAYRKEGRATELIGLEAGSDSLIAQRVFDGRTRCRILNHQIVQERRETFGTDGYDTLLVERIETLINADLKSWIASPVKNGEESTAVVMVVNKSWKQYLPALFSRTDEILIDHISEQLSKTLARIHVRDAMREISEHTFQTRSSMAEAGDGLLQIVREHIPGITAIAVTLWDRKSLVDSLYKEYGATNDNERQRLKDWCLHLRQVPDKSDRFLTTIDERKNRFVYKQRLATITDITSGVLHVLSQRRRLADYEREILEYLSSDLTQVVRNEVIAQRELQQLIQVRHAIRSGLQGVQHLDTAWEVHEHIATNGVTPANFRLAMLRKSLQWSRLFARRTAVLIDEARYMIEGLSRNNLRLGSHSISGIVKENIVALEVDAEHRNIEIQFQNDLRPESWDNASVDRLLMGISVFNLLDNAVKYSYRGTTIKVRLTGSFHEWTLSIQNRGVFIRPEDREDIFKPMVRKPTGQGSDKRPGTGLGLTVVKMVVEAHGGKVEVDSLIKHDDDALTTFAITAPRMHIASRLTHPS